VFGRFMGLANALGWVTPKATADQPTSLGVEVPPVLTPAELVPVLTLLNTHPEESTRCIAATHCAGDIHGSFGSALHVAFECAQERV